MIKLVIFIVLISTLVFFTKTQQSHVNDTYRPLGDNEVRQQAANNNTNNTQKDEKPIPVSEKILQNDYHIFQSFNNCGPAALSMTLSYYGISKSQQELGSELRPFQNPQGDNDDKSVTLQELAEKSKEFGFTPYHRPVGNMQLMELFITYDMPVITRTWLKENEDIGHFRVIKGYDQSTKELTQDDSLQGKNLRYSYDDFNTLWKKFNYEYLVLVPNDKVEIAKKILGNYADADYAWKQAVQLSTEQLQANPDDVYARFNLSVAYYHLKDYKKAVDEFEKVQNRLSGRTLWYQIEPIQAYYELGLYEKVFDITDSILNNNNRAFSELYIIRGDIYNKQGNLQAAEIEYEKAVFYNTGLKSAKERLTALD